MSHAWLRARAGHDFPVLARIGPRRVVRALATMLRDNLDPASSIAGIPRKLSAGLVFARTVGNVSLEAQLRSLGKLGGPAADAAVEALARAISPSPAVIDDGVLAQARTLAPAALVEIVAFVALMQLLHRAESFYAA